MSKIKIASSVTALFLFAAGPAFAQATDEQPTPETEKQDAAAPETNPMPAEPTPDPAPSAEPMPGQTPEVGTGPSAEPMPDAQRQPTPETPPSPSAEPSPTEPTPSDTDPATPDVGAGTPNTPAPSAQPNPAEPTPSDPMATESPADESTSETAAAERGVPAASSNEYVVEQGDTLGEIARKLTGDESNWEAIARENGIDDPAKLQVGARLRVPAGLSDEPESERVTSEPSPPTP